MPLSKEIRTAALLLSADYQKTPSSSTAARMALNQRYKTLLTDIAQHVHQNSGDLQDGVNLLFDVLSAASTSCGETNSLTLANMGIQWENFHSDNPKWIIGEPLIQKINDSSSSSLRGISSDSSLHAKRQSRAKMPASFPIQTSIFGFNNSNNPGAPPNSPSKPSNNGASTNNTPNYKSQAENPQDSVSLVLDSLSRMMNRENFARKDSSERKKAAEDLAYYIAGLQNVPSKEDIEQSIRNDATTRFSSRIDDLVDFWGKVYPKIDVCIENRQIIAEYDALMQELPVQQTDELDGTFQTRMSEFSLTHQSLVKGWESLTDIVSKYPVKKKNESESDFQENVAAYLTYLPIYRKKYQTTCQKAFFLFRQGDGDPDVVKKRNALMQRLTKKMAAEGLETVSFQTELNALDSESKRRVLLNPHWQYILCKSGTPIESMQIPDFKQSDVETLAVNLIAAFAETYEVKTVADNQQFVEDKIATIVNKQNTMRVEAADAGLIFADLLKDELNQITLKNSKSTLSNVDVQLFLQDEKHKQSIIKSIQINYNPFPAYVWKEFERDENEHKRKGNLYYFENAKEYYNKDKLKPVVLSLNDTTMEVVFDEFTTKKTWHVLGSAEKVVGLRKRDLDGRTYRGKNLANFEDGARSNYIQKRNEILLQCKTAIQINKRISVIRSLFNKIEQAKQEGDLTPQNQENILAFIREQCNSIKPSKEKLTTEEGNSLRVIIDTLMSNVTKMMSNLSNDDIEKKSSYIQGVISVMLCDPLLSFPDTLIIFAHSKTIRDSLISNKRSTTELDEITKIMLVQYLKPYTCFSDIIKLLQKFPHGFEAGYQILYEQTQTVSEDKFNTQFNFDWVAITTLFFPNNNPQNKNKITPLTFEQQWALFKILWKAEDNNNTSCCEFFKLLIPQIIKNLLNVSPEEFQLLLHEVPETLKLSTLFKTLLETKSSVLLGTDGIEPDNFSKQSFKDLLQTLSRMILLSSKNDPNTIIEIFWGKINGQEKSFTLEQRKSLIDLVNSYPNLRKGDAYQQFINASSPVIISHLYSQNEQNETVLNMPLLGWINKAYIFTLNNNVELAKVFFNKLVEVVKAGAKRKRTNSHDNISNELQCVIDLFLNCSTIPTELISTMFVYVKQASINISNSDDTQNNLQQLLVKYLRKKDVSLSQGIDLVKDYPLGLEKGSEIWYTYFKENIESVYEKKNTGEYVNAIPDSLLISKIFNASLKLFEVFIENKESINCPAFEKLLEKLKWVAEHSTTPKEYLEQFWSKVTALHTKLHTGVSTSPSPFNPARPQDAKALHDVLLEAIVRHPELLSKSAHSPRSTPVANECMHFFTAKDISALVNQYVTAKDINPKLFDFLNNWLIQASESAKQYSPEKGRNSEPTFFNSDDFIMPDVVREHLYRRRPENTGVFVSNKSLSKTRWIGSLSSCIQVQEIDVDFQIPIFYDQVDKSINRNIAERSDVIELCDLIQMISDGEMSLKERREEDEKVDLEKKSQCKLITLKGLKSVGFTSAEFLDAGYTKNYLLKAGFSETELNTPILVTTEQKNARIALAEKRKEENKQSITYLKNKKGVVASESRNAFETEKNILSIIGGLPRRLQEKHKKSGDLINTLAFLERTLYLRLNEGESATISQLKLLLSSPKERNTLEIFLDTLSHYSNDQFKNNSAAASIKKYISNMLHMLLLTDPIACLMSLIDREDSRNSAWLQSNTSVLPVSSDYWGQCITLLQAGGVFGDIDVSNIPKVKSFDFKERLQTAIKNYQTAAAYAGKEDPLLKKNWLAPAIQENSIIVLNFDTTNKTATTNLELCLSNARSTFDLSEVAPEPQSLGGIIWDYTFGVLWKGIKAVGNVIGSIAKTIWDYSFGAIWKGMKDAYNAVSTKDDTDNDVSHDGDTAASSTESSRHNSVEDVAANDSHVRLDNTTANPAVQQANLTQQTTTAALFDGALKSRSTVIETSPTEENTANHPQQQNQDSTNSVGFFGVQPLFKAVPNKNTPVQTKTDQQIVKYVKNKKNQKGQTGWCLPWNNNKAPIVPATSNVSSNINNSNG